MTRNDTHRGFTILIAIIVASIVLAIALAILGITLKQLALAGIARESEIAFQAANAGVECIRRYDISGSSGDTLDVAGNGSTRAAASINCLTGSNVTGSPSTYASGGSQRFSWTWGDGKVCTDATVYKFYSTSASVSMAAAGVSRTCPEDVECTVIKSRGYNVPCSAVSSSRVVERELTVIY